jgi:hypothetical protein
MPPWFIAYSYLTYYCYVMGRTFGSYNGITDPEMIKILARIQGATHILMTSPVVK